LVKLERLEIILFACGLNDGSGCSNLGLSYEKGKGVKQDDFKALKLSYCYFVDSVLFSWFFWFFLVFS
jgi:hypothetical protein